MTGFRVLYQVAIEGGWFNGREKTAFDSVFYASAEALIDMVSLKNSAL